MTPSIPVGMVAVGREEFFALLRADPRDIMPSHAADEWTTWETTRRERWGWSAPGWRNPGAHPPIYAVTEEVVT